MLRSIFLVLIAGFIPYCLASETFLPPDQAFAFEQGAQSGEVVLHWRIADGYYLYRDRIALWADGQPLKVKAWPTSISKDDPNFGLVEIYKKSLSLRVAPPENSQVKVQYQGCADGGLCYPPQTKYVTFQGRAPAASVVGEEFTPVQNIVNSLASRSPLYTLLLFLGMGVITAFSGCSYPMFPILSRVIIGSGNVEDIGRMRGFSLSLVYVLPIALVYAAIGVVAGLLGENLSSWFQTTWVLGVVSTILILMGMSMIGLYQIELPSQLQSKLDQVSRRQKGGTYTGAAVMGFVSAFIVSACVVPPMVAATTFITQSGNWMLGASAMFFFGFGLGVPLLMLGASASWLLPRAGQWMLTLQRTMGFLLITAAIWIADRFLPGWLVQILWASLAAGAGVYVFRQRRSGVNRALGGALLGIAVVLLIWPAFQSVNTNSRLPFDRFETISSFEKEVAASDKPVIVDVYADWCTACQTLEHDVLSAPEIQQKLERFHRIQLDLSASNVEAQAFLKKFRILGPPTFLFLSPTGEELEGQRITGKVSVAELSKTLTRVTKSTKNES